MTNANGVRGARVPAGAWVERGSWLTLGSAETPLGGGRVFLGWSADRTATEPDYLAGSSYVFDADTALFAVWGTARTATLTFADSLPDPATGMPAPVTIVPAASPRVRIPSEIPQKSGRAFVGWNTEQDGSGVTYAPGTALTLTEDRTLWAQWVVAEGSWFVAFDANGGQSAPQAQVVTVGQDAILTLELPVNGSLAFRGWATTPDAAEVAYQPGDTLPYEEGRTYVVLYALWQLSSAPGPVIVTFDANGSLAGTVPGPVSVPGETWFRLPEGMPIWDPQHQFLDWSEDSAAAEATWAAGDTAIFERDATLYAVWQAHYKVIEGAGSTYVKGSGKTMRFVADGDLRYFRELRIDGLPVSTGVTISSGSTIADVSSEVMEALPTGEHTITFVYMDGEASAGFTVQSATPPTPTPPTPTPPTPPVPPVPIGPVVPPVPIVPGWIYPPSGGDTPRGRTTPSGGDTSGGGATPTGGVTPTEVVPTGGGATPTQVPSSTGGGTAAAVPTSQGGTSTAAAGQSAASTPPSGTKPQQGTVPSTGDTGSYAAWAALAALAGVWLALAGVLRRGAGRSR